MIKFITERLVEGRRRKVKLFFRMQQAISISFNILTLRIENFVPFLFIFAKKDCRSGEMYMRKNFPRVCVTCS